MEQTVLSPKRKALLINLDELIYGSFAEIGAGQEVSRLFFQAGGASGTIARTISAYDMAFSDELYGKSGRYVSKARLVKMLKTEFNQVTTILKEKRDPFTKFFSYANTVTTINYAKTNEGHGWVGMRFQLNPKSEPNQVVMHIRLLENDALMQQQTLGIFGSNFIYACYNYYDKPNTFLRSLLDNLSTDRIEIDMIEMTGPDLDYVDNRLLSVQLVKNGMTCATMFDRNGKVQQPADMLYKKNVMVLRGSFRPITYVGFDMLKTGYSLFKKETGCDKKEMMVLCEMTLNNLLSEGDFDERDFLDRVDILNGMGQNVMVSSFREFYKLTDYLGRFRLKNIRIMIGVLNFVYVIDKKYYKDLRGGILQAFGKLFSTNTKLYIYPTLDRETKKVVTSKTLEIPEDIQYLYRHLYENGQIIDIENFKKNRLHILSREVLKKIQKGEAEWLDMVPNYISDQITTKKLFGFKPVDESLSTKDSDCEKSS